MIDKNNVGVITVEDLIFYLSASFGIGGATNKVKERGFENERYITVDMFIDILKNSWTIVPNTVKKNLRN